MCEVVAGFGWILAGLLQEMRSFPEIPRKLLRRLNLNGRFVKLFLREINILFPEEDELFEQSSNKRLIFNSQKALLSGN
jgi:hypothetical protein